MRACLQECRLSQVELRFQDLRDRAVCLRILVIFGVFVTPALAVQTVQPDPLARQTAPSVVAEQEVVTAEQLAELRKQAEAAELQEELRKQILAALDQAAEQLTRAAGLREKAAASQAAVAAAEVRARELQAQIDALQTKPAPGLGAGLTDPKAIEAEILTREAQLVELRKQLADLQGVPAALDTRRKELTAAQATLSDRLNEAKKALASPPPADEAPLLSNVRRALAQARLQALEAEGPAIAAELARLAAEQAVDLTGKRQALLKRQVSKLDAEVSELRKMQNKVRAAAAQNADLGDIPPDSPEGKKAQEWLDRNRRLATELIPTVVRRETDRRQALEVDQGREDRLKQRVEKLGMVASVGMELQEELSRPRDIRQIQRDIAAREEELAKLSADVLDHQRLLEELKEELDPDLPGQRRRVLESQIRILESLVQNETAYIEALRRLDTQERLLVEARQGFEAWLRERVLWVRSNTLLGPRDVVAAGLTVHWLLAPERWATVPAALVDDVLRHAGLYISVCLLLVVVTFLQPRGRRELTAIGAQAKRVSATQFGPTLRAVWLTVLIAVVWPGLLWFLGSRLRQPGMDDFARAVGAGLQSAGLCGLVLNFLRQVCRHGGLGEAHFAWDNDAVRRVRAQLRTLLPVLLPLIFLQSLLHEFRNAPGGDSLERFCLIAILLMLGVLSLRLLHPRSGVFAAALEEHENGWANRTAWLWYPAAVGVPLVLAVLVVAGYFFTAHELAWRLAATGTLVLGLILLQALLIRWHLVNQRRLRIEQARKRRQRLLESGAAVDAGVLEGNETDLLTVSQQTLRLINTGLMLTGLVAAWFLWSDVLPAVSFLDRFELWKTTAQISVERVIDGRTVYQTEIVDERVTALNALMALFLLAVTITAARNLPGLLEVILLQRLPLEPAMRYAIRTVVRYVIVLVGATMSFSAIGIGWAKVQWLAAGLTVGLGFGLQEIFANFVSGLIILFERPVRIGDIVTIEGVSGTVSRIQIRATTVTDWDRREYIVPNKDLVTGRLLNWTLSDKTNRVLIEVGVAYGTDTQKARSVLLEVAAQHPLVLADPEPLATFEKFADSTLNLVLRCYLPDFENRLRSITELHEAIDRAFADAGISIAFPQLDVHLTQNSDVPA